MPVAAAKKSRISPDIDFARDGKQVSALAVPHSRNESAWGSIRLPLTVIKNGDGPTVLFTGANHGDEYEGPVALSKLARALDPAEVRGRVIVMPALNLPALRAGTRVSPIDGRNMNRVFPGAREGTVTEVIAHYVQTELLPLADVVVDLHSGGRSLVLVPCAVMHRLADRALMERTLAALRAFGAPVGLVIEELDSEGMLDSAVENMGKIFLSTELGGGATLTPESMRIADAGVRNVLRHFGVLDGAPTGDDTRLMEVPDAGCYLIAKANGIYEPTVGLGEAVAPGQVVGRLHFIEEPDRDPIEIRCARAGTLIGRRVQGHSEIGDCLGVLATDLADA